jgi:hypothetical protein
MATAGVDYSFSSPPAKPASIARKRGRPSKVPTAEKTGTHDMRGSALIACQEPKEPTREPKSPKSPTPGRKGMPRHDDKTYITADDENVASIALVVNRSVRSIIEANRPLYPELTPKARLYEGTHLTIPTLDEFAPKIDVLNKLTSEQPEGFEAIVGLPRSTLKTMFKLDFEDWADFCAETKLKASDALYERIQDCVRRAVWRKTTKRTAEVDDHTGTAAPVKRNEWLDASKKARAAISKIRRAEFVIDTYSAEGWQGRNAQLVMPKKELVDARKALRAARRAVRVIIAEVDAKVAAHTPLDASKADGIAAEDM